MDTSLKALLEHIILLCAWALNGELTTIDEVLASIDYPSAPQPSPVPTIKTAQVITTALNIRDAPSVYGRDIGDLRNGEVVEVLEESADGLNIWVRIGHGQWWARQYNGRIYLQDIK